jgi:hypothetical protein
VPLASPRKRIVHRLMANDTIAKLKIVLPKSYSAHASATQGLPAAVSAPMARHQDRGPNRLTGR